MLLHVPLQMLQGARTIAASLFQLRDREQRVIRVVRQWILDDDAAIIALGLRSRRRQRAVPVEGVAVRRSGGIRCAKQRIDERTTGDAVPFRHQPARAPEERVRRRTRRRARDTEGTVGRWRGLAADERRREQHGSEDGITAHLAGGKRCVRPRGARNQRRKA